MNAARLSVALLPLLFAAESSRAQVYGPPVQWSTGAGANGNTYQIVRSGPISWIDANTDAESQVHNGVPGHLVTIGSAEESAFVNQLLASETTGFWLGGFQSRGATDPEAGWEWVNADGDIPAPGGSPGYENWAAGEPDELGPINNVLLQEDFLAIYDSAWYSEGFSGAVSADLYSISGYLVEYDTGTAPLEETSGVVDPKECRANTGGCETVPEQTLTLPDEAEVEDGATIEYRSFRFSDPRADQQTGRCIGISGDESRRPLDVFEGDQELGGQFILPEYLCGSPAFVVVKTKVTGVTIPRGTVFIENEQLEDNFFGCEQPIPPTTDPQEQDTVVWQSTGPEGMPEQTYDNQYRPNIGRNWQGSAGEFTTGCGSSEGQSAGLSFFAIGLHVDFGAEWENNTAFVLDELVLLTRYKILILQDAVDNAEHVLDEDDHKKLARKARKVLKELDDDEYDDALRKIREFIKHVNRFEYALSDFNHHGEHLARARNIEFMLAQKVLPYHDD